MTNFLDDQNASYDKLAKSFLSRKAILAQILKYTVEEFANCALEDIEKKYIEGDPHFSINTIPLDDTLDIKGKPNESSSTNESFITFDIIFDVVAPVDGKPVKIIINVEPQKTTRKIHYKLMKRAVYYAARLISDQKEKEFHGDEYNELKKVYSIWICMGVQNYRADSIQRYNLSEEIIHGNFHDAPKNYDLISIVILNLGNKPTSHRLLNLLYLIFMDLKPSDEKEIILHDEYHIDISRDMREELKKMGGLMEPAIEVAVERNAERVTAETKKQTLLESVRNLMETLNLTAKQAMDALKIPANKQKEYADLI